MRDKCPKGNQVIDRVAGGTYGELVPCGEDFQYCDDCIKARIESEIDYAEMARLEQIQYEGR